MRKRNAEARLPCLLLIRIRFIYVERRTRHSVSIDGRCEQDLTAEQNILSILAIHV